MTHWETVHDYVTQYINEKTLSQSIDALMPLVACIEGSERLQELSPIEALRQILLMHAKKIYQNYTVLFITCGTEECQQNISDSKESFLHFVDNTLSLLPNFQSTFHRFE